MFLVDGSPDGIVTAEIMNWTGHVLAAPRSRLPEVIQRNEGQRTGLYLLFGDQPSSVGERRKCYVGESDDVGRRVGQHNRDGDKDWFERFCLITNKDLNLTKAHTRYLESLTVQTAREVDRVELVNGNEPPSGLLSESDMADMRGFFEQLRIVLPVLGFDVLKGFPAGRQGEASGDDGLRLVLQSPAKRPLEASAIERNGELTVLAGSQAIADPNNKTSEPYRDMRRLMLAEGSLERVDSKTLRFTRDVPFTSPSAASGFIYGRSDNGRTSWLLEGSSMTLRDHQLKVQEELTGATERTA